MAVARRPSAVAAADPCLGKERLSTAAAAAGTPARTPTPQAAVAAVSSPVPGSPMSVGASTPLPVAQGHPSVADAVQMDLGTLALAPKASAALSLRTRSSPARVTPSAAFASYQDPVQSPTNAIPLPVQLDLPVPPSEPVVEEFVVKQAARQAPLAPAPVSDSAAAAAGPESPVMFNGLNLRALPPALLRFIPGAAAALAAHQRGTAQPEPPGSAMLPQRIGLLGDGSKTPEGLTAARAIEFPAPKSALLPTAARLRLLQPEEEGDGGAAPDAALLPTVRKSRLVRDAFPGAALLPSVGEPCRHLMTAWAAVHASIAGSCRMGTRAVDPASNASIGVADVAARLEALSIERKREVHRTIEVQTTPMAWDEEGDSDEGELQAPCLAVARNPVPMAPAACLAGGAMLERREGGLTPLPLPTDLGMGSPALFSPPMEEGDLAPAGAFEGSDDDEDDGIGGGYDFGIGFEDDGADFAFAPAPTDDARATREPRPKKPKHARLREQVRKRQSLAVPGVGLDRSPEQNRIRRSTRDRTKPIEWWRGEGFEYSRQFHSLATVGQWTTKAQDPIWPAPDPRPRRASEDEGAGKASRGPNGWPGRLPCLSAADEPLVCLCAAAGAWGIQGPWRQEEGGSGRRRGCPGPPRPQAGPAQAPRVQRDWQRCRGGGRRCRCRRHYRSRPRRHGRGAGGGSRRAAAGGAGGRVGGHAAHGQPCLPGNPLCACWQGPGPQHPKDVRLVHGQPGGQREDGHRCRGTPGSAAPRCAAALDRVCARLVLTRSPNPQARPHRRTRRSSGPAARPPWGRSRGHLSSRRWMMRRLLMHALFLWGARCWRPPPRRTPCQRTS